MGVAAEDAAATGQRLVARQMNAAIAHAIIGCGRFGGWAAAARSAPVVVPRSSQSSTNTATRKSRIFMR